MESTQMNLGTTKGLSFADLRSKFYAKPLKVGEHRLIIKSLDLSNPTLNEKGTRETVLLIAQVDGENHVREERISAWDVDNLLTKAIERYPEQLGDCTQDTLIQTIVDDKLELQFWFAQNTKAPQYYNWVFIEPQMVQDAVVADGTAANSLT